MNTYIALLRGINVGGNNKLPMKELITVLEGLKLHNAKTYIQSGNVVFQSERADRAVLSQEISEAIGESHGFTPYIFLLSIEDVQAAINANPFPEGKDEPKTLHFFFLDGILEQPNLEAFEQLKTETERFQLIGDVLYLHAPDGIGRSKLAGKLSGKWKGLHITARNWRTVSKVVEMAKEVMEGA